jgi:hypothetical protein
MQEIKYDLSKGYTEIDGFIFTMVTSPANIHDGIVIRNPENAVAEYPRSGFSKKTLEEHIDYINRNRLEKARIYADDISFLSRCSGLKYLDIIPSNNAKQPYDFTPLYNLSEVLSLNCRNQYGDRDQFTSDIDYSKINGLIDLNITVNKSTLNFNRIETLKSLYISNFKSDNHDLTDLFCSEQLDTLTMVQSNVRSLKGINFSKKMQCLYLHYNRSLLDISDLVSIKDTLKLLRIENCSKISDFSSLRKLENLELLELTGSNTLQSLDFIRDMKNLKTFVFNMDVFDGDLSACLNLSYVYSGKDRKHFNIKDKDLPKGLYVRGNENIDKWRRKEY